MIAHSLLPGKHNTYILNDTPCTIVWHFLYHWKQWAVVWWTDTQPVITRSDCWWVTLDGREWLDYLHELWVGTMVGTESLGKSSVNAMRHFIVFPSFHSCIVFLNRQGRKWDTTLSKEKQWGDITENPRPTVSLLTLHMEDAMNTNDLRLTANKMLIRITAIDFRHCPGDTCLLW